MRTIAARELKVGMESEDGAVVTYVEHTDNFIEVTFQTYDYDCGEFEYYPMQVSFEDEFNIL